jgi:adenosine deaminase
MLQEVPDFPTLFQWTTRLPKVELHLHLEGAVPLEALWELVQKYGGDPDTPNLEALQARFVYRDFPHFIDTWMWKNQFLRELEDFSFAAEAVARDLAAQNILYVEAFYSPPDFARYGLSPQGLTAAIRAGLDRVPDVRVNLIADVVRDYGPAAAAHTLAELREVQDSGVIGIGLGGSEQAHPPEPFAAVFAQARAWGFHTTAHAGEAAGAPSIWGATDALQAERIGHGARAGEDPRLLDVLAERQIPIEMCPLSNVRTGVVKDIAAHPIRKYFERGLFVTVNTDDPKMFNNSLAEEYALLVAVLGFSPSELEQLILNGIRASWLAETDKASLLSSFEQEMRELKALR